jgi:signal peptidase I
MNENKEENNVSSSPIVKENKAKSFIKETLYIVVLAFVIVLPFRIFIAQPYIVSGSSMDNTFQNGNYLIINEISYRFNEPQRGEVIVFKTPPKGLEIQGVSETKIVYYIKRIIGLPGETVEIDGDTVKIYNSEFPEGKLLDEPYVYIEDSTSSPFSKIKQKITLNKDEYFVMGDNRHNSSDSRLWGILPKKNIIGKTYLRLFPFNKISVNTGEYNNY